MKEGTLKLTDVCCSYVLYVLYRVLFVSLKEHLFWQIFSSLILPILKISWSNATRRLLSISNPDTGAIGFWVSRYTHVVFTMTCFDQAQSQVTVYLLMSYDFLFACWTLANMSLEFKERAARMKYEAQTKISLSVRKATSLAKSATSQKKSTAGISDAEKSVTQAADDGDSCEEDRIGGIIEEDSFCQQDDDENCTVAAANNIS